MREIKFRAMTRPPKDFAHYKFARSEMVFGTGILYDGINTWLIANKENTAIRSGMTEKIVRPETVGLYTGLKDKNGVEIYKGDICNATFKNGFMGDVKVVGKIVFDDSMWLLKTENKNLEYQIYSLNRLGNFEVIGNIYENKELIDG
jgi:uncharacterized phage protein (TIGR01671 family)